MLDPKAGALFADENVDEAIAIKGEREVFEVFIGADGD
jgi:hypothetical protein